MNPEWKAWEGPKGFIIRKIEIKINYVNKLRQLFGSYEHQTQLEQRRSSCIYTVTGASPHARKLTGMINWRKMMMMIVMIRV
jgi:hypothetical protein